MSARHLQDIAIQHSETLIQHFNIAIQRHLISKNIRSLNFCTKMNEILSKYIYFQLGVLESFSRNHFIKTDEDS